MSEFSSECLFCGGPADTEEHVIPDWMQRDFDLKQMKLILPNRSEFKYLHAKVPACSLHNGKFSAVEDRIKNRSCTNDELYLWAFKVHTGLMFLDSSLKANIRDPSSGPLAPPGIFAGEIKHFRNLFKIWATENYQFTPSPPGSVFILPALTQHFDFIHSYLGRSLGVSLGDQFLCVLFYDHGHAMRAELHNNWNPSQVIEIPTSISSEERAALLDQRQFVMQRVWLCETSYWAHRLRLSSTIIFTDNQFLLPFFSDRPAIRPPDSNEYGGFCQSFGIELVADCGEYFQYRLST